MSRNKRHRSGTPTTCRVLAPLPDARHCKATECHCLWTISHSSSPCSRRVVRACRLSKLQTPLREFATSAVDVHLCLENPCGAQSLGKCRNQTSLLLADRWPYAKYGRCDRRW